MRAYNNDVTSFGEVTNVLVHFCRVDKEIAKIITLLIHRTGSAVAIESKAKEFCIDVCACFASIGVKSDIEERA